MSARPGQQTLEAFATDFASIPKDSPGQENYLKEYEKRMALASQAEHQGYKDSYTVVHVNDLPQSHGDLHRKDTVDYQSANWPKIASVSCHYLKEGNDPTDISLLASYAQEKGLEADEAKWLESIFKDPIRYSATSKETSFVNGRHRTNAMQSQEVEYLVVNDERAMEKAYDIACQYRSGQLEIRPDLEDLEKEGKADFSFQESLRSRDRITFLSIDMSTSIRASIAELSLEKLFRHKPLVAILVYSAWKLFLVKQVFEPSKSPLTGQR